MKKGQWVIRFKCGNLTLWEVEDAGYMVSLKHADSSWEILTPHDTPSIISVFNNKEDAEHAFEILHGLKSVFDDTIETIETKRNTAILQAAKQWGMKQ